MKKIKIAQIGTAHDHALQNFNSLLRQTEIFDVAGYARVEQEDGFAFEHLKDKEISLDALFSIPDLEAVTIETFDLTIWFIKVDFPALVLPIIETNPDFILI